MVHNALLAGDRGGSLSMERWLAAEEDKPTGTRGTSAPGDMRDEDEVIAEMEAIIEKMKKK